MNNPGPSTSRGSGGSGSNCGNDDMNNHLEQVDQNINKPSRKYEHRREVPRTFVSGKELQEFSYTGSFIDFEGSPFKFEIGYPPGCLGVSTDVYVGNTTITHLRHFEKSIHGHIIQVVRAILDMSMSGPLCACVTYFDADQNICETELNAEVKVIPRQEVDITSMEVKGRIRASVSSFNVPQIKKQPKPLPRSATIEENKWSEIYKRYNKRFRNDGFFIRQRVAMPTCLTRKPEIPSVELFRGVVDYLPLPPRSFTTNVLPTTDYSHEFPIPSPRETKSEDGCCSQKVTEEVYVFARCSPYKRATPQSPDCADDKEKRPVVYIIREGVIRKSRSEESLMVSDCPECPEDSPTKAKLKIKEKIKNLMMPKRKVVDRVSNRIQLAAKS